MITQIRQTPKLAKQANENHETFGFTCCPLSDEEVEQEGIIVYPLAQELILILVRNDNPIDNLSSEQVHAIFRREIVNWKEVGGTDKPIVVVTRLHCEKRPGHWKTILPSHKNFREVRLNVKLIREAQNGPAFQRIAWQYALLPLNSQ